jgi:hypothetical protein
MQRKIADIPEDLTTFKGVAKSRSLTNANKSLRQAKQLKQNG